VAAAGLADVGAGDPHPLEVLGRRQHPPQQLAVAGLDLLTLAQGATRRSDPRREGVPHLLQAAEPERARLAPGSRNRGVELEPREGLGHQGGELPLEAADLTAQLGASKSLVAAYAKLGTGISI
jgi:hypothetical protein